MSFLIVSRGGKYSELSFFYIRQYGGFRRRRWASSRAGGWLGGEGGLRQEQLHMVRGLPNAVIISPLRWKGTTRWMTYRLHSTADCNLLRLNWWSGNTARTQRRRSRRNEAAASYKKQKQKERGRHTHTPPQDGDWFTLTQRPMVSHETCIVAVDRDISRGQRNDSQMATPAE